MDINVSERETGAFPLSIGTSFAFEGACGIHPDHPEKEAPIKNFDEVWVNVKTLFRNLFNACSPECRKMADATDMAQHLLLELMYIKTIPSSFAGKFVNVVFYISDYSGLDTKYSRAVTRRNSTALQIHYFDTMNETLKQLLKQITENQDNDIKIEIFTLKLKPKQKQKTLILTNYAFDLTSYKSFGKLTLLESHTGVVKEYGQWYTKYYNSKELFRFPFNEGFLQVFGDSETFRPMDHKIREALIPIAEKYQWVPTSTKDKIMYGINQLKNPYMKEILREIID